MPQLASSVGGLVFVEYGGESLVVDEDVELLPFHEVAKTLDGTVDSGKLPVKSAVLRFCRCDVL